MHIFRYDSPRFRTQMKALSRRAAAAPEVVETVREILAAVSVRGNAAVLEYTAKFGGLEMKRGAMRVTAAEFKEADANTTDNVKVALSLAHENVRSFARRGLRKSWRGRNRQGVEVGETFHPFQRVGIYVPGGNAPLVSTAIMTVTLAAAAGVPEIVVATPADAHGRLHPPLLYALQLAGATEVYRIGGAQAIAAMAHGTRTIAPVTKIFGPGNAYVVEAKRQVFGIVGIDLLPGPSEILIIADRTADPAWIAADLLAQAEHGHGSVVLLTDSEPLLGSVREALRLQMAGATRGEHLARVVGDTLYLVLVEKLADAVAIANDFAPEHVVISARQEEQLAESILTAGAIFLGRWSPVSGGDFVAGPSHELPTGGSGKSFSGLTVDQFQRRTSIVRFDEKSLRKSLQAIETISAIEGLDRHGASAAIRLATGSQPFQ
ncbi:MAG: histidinol dehydrogenase [Prosthecobacter sp.]|nr:MAG: histidinol dehydrogenase [Chthoniobacter sp. 12-60-6]